MNKMDRKNQDIAILYDFKITLQMWNLNHQQIDRSKINQLLPKVRNILNVTKSNKYVNIDAPLNMGGQHIVQGGNSLDLIFDAPFNLDVSHYVYDAIDSAIGVLSDDEFDYTVKQNVSTQEQPKVDSKKVFVVYGHDRLMKLEVENFLRSKLKLDVVALDEEPNGGRTIIEKFEHYSKDCAFAVILMSPDDDVDVDGQIYKRARQNVVLELGYFMAKLGRDKVCVLVRGDIEKPSDISGILNLSYDGEWKFDLLTELKNAGIEV